MMMFSASSLALCLDISVQYSISPGMHMSITRYKAFRYSFTAMLPTSGKVVDIAACMSRKAKCALHELISLPREISSCR